MVADPSSTMISILKRDSTCPALPAGLSEEIGTENRSAGADFSVFHGLSSRSGEVQVAPSPGGLPDGGLGNWRRSGRDGPARFANRRRGRCSCRLAGFDNLPSNRFTVTATRPAGPHLGPKCLPAGPLLTVRRPDVVAAVRLTLAASGREVEAGRDTASRGAKHLILPAADARSARTASRFHSGGGTCQYADGQQGESPADPSHIGTLLSTKRITSTGFPDGNRQGRRQPGGETFVTSRCQAERLPRRR